MKTFLVLRKLCQLEIAKVYPSIGARKHQPILIAISLNCGRFGYRQRTNSVEENYSILADNIKYNRPRIIHLQECLYNERFFQILQNYGYSLIYVPTIFFSDNPDLSAGLLTAYYGNLDQIDVSLIYHPVTSFPDVKKVLKKFSISEICYWSIKITETAYSLNWVNIHNSAFTTNSDRINIITSLINLFKDGDVFSILGDLNMYGDIIDATPKRFIPRNFQFLRCFFSLLYRKYIIRYPGFYNGPNNMEILQIHKLVLTKSNFLELRFLYSDKPTFEHIIKISAIEIVIGWILDGLITNHFNWGNLRLEEMNDYFDHKIIQIID